MTTSTGATRMLHVLVVEADEADADDLTYRIECPYPPDTFPLPCATWEECGCSMPPIGDDEDRPDEHYDESPCPRHPGLSHQYDGEFSGELCAGLGPCWPREYADLGDSVPDQLGQLAAGRYPITYVVEDGSYLVPALAARDDSSSPPPAAPEQPRVSTTEESA